MEGHTGSVWRRAKYTPSLSYPRLQHRVHRHRRRSAALHGHEAAALEAGDGVLHGALREAGPLGDGAQARLGPAARVGGVAPEIQVDEEGRRAAVVADEVGEQDVDHVCVELEAGRGWHGS